MDLEHQEVGPIDEGLLDQVSDDEEEEQQQVDLAPKRVHLSEDGDVQSLNDGIAKVKVLSHGSDGGKQHREGGARCRQLQCLT